MCVLTSGRTTPCKDAIGGNKNAFLIDFIEDAFTITAGEATAINGSIADVYKYELRNDGNTFVETVNSDSNTGTTTYEQVSSIVLAKQDVATTNELDIVSKANPIVVVQDRNGVYRVQGLSDGTVVTGSNESGGAKSDFNGYNRTFTSTEGSPAPALDAATVTALLDLV